MEYITCDACFKSNREVEIIKNVVLKCDHITIIQDVCKECLTLTLISGVKNFEAPSVRKIFLHPVIKKHNKLLTLKR